MRITCLQSPTLLVGSSNCGSLVSLITHKCWHQSSILSVVSVFFAATWHIGIRIDPETNFRGISGTGTKFCQKFRDPQRTGNFGDEKTSSNWYHLNLDFSHIFRNGATVEPIKAFVSIDAMTGPSQPVFHFFLVIAPIWI